MRRIFCRVAASAYKLLRQDIYLSFDCESAPKRLRNGFTAVLIKVDCLIGKQQSFLSYFIKVVTFEIAESFTPPPPPEFAS